MNLSLPAREVAQFLRYLLRPPEIGTGFGIRAVVGHQVIVRHDSPAQRAWQIIGVPGRRIFLQFNDLSVIGVADRAAHRGGIVLIRQIDRIERPEIWHVVVIDMRRRDSGEHTLGQHDTRRNQTGGQEFAHTVHQQRHGVLRNEVASACSGRQKGDD